MKSFLPMIAFCVLYLLSNIGVQAQTLNQKSTSTFVIFSTNGSVSNTGISQVSGNVGTNNGSNTAFGNVNGIMHAQDSVSAICSADLLGLYNQIDTTISTYFPAPLLGNDTFTAGVYQIASASTLNGTINFDAAGNPNAVFIVKINGSFSTGASAKVKLLRGAMACNIYWKIEGMVNMASGTAMKGTVIAHNSAIVINTGDTIEGRLFSINGAITINNTMAYIPVGCGSPYLTGPVAPTFKTIDSYAIFSSNGSVTNAGVSKIKGDIGTNVGLTTGFDTTLVKGFIHPIPDLSTSIGASDLLTTYTYLNLLSSDIELLYPIQFGRNLVLTPHTYLMNAATTLTDTVYLNAMGNANAVFIIKINGALSTSTFSKVILTNGTQAKNVFWKIEGAVSINANSIINGNIICNNGAIQVMNGATINGRILTTNGTVLINSITDTLLQLATSMPFILSTQSDSICNKGTVTLMAIASAGVVNWYHSPVGGTSLYTGNNYTTPILSISDTFYVDATLGSQTTLMRAMVIAKVMSVDTVVTKSNTLLSARSMGTYQWYKSSSNDCNNFIPISGAVNQSYDVTANGYYMVNITKNGCNLNSSCISVNTVGISELNGVKHFSISPNPFNNSILLRKLDNSNTRKYEFKLMNVMGELIYNNTITDNQLYINTEGIKSGIYFYQLIENNQIIQSGKLISE